MTFFVTAATVKQQKQHAGVKRQADAPSTGIESLRGQLEELALTKKNQFIPLTDVREIIMDHVLESMDTDLKHTVLLVCEDVPDFREEDAAAKTTELIPFLRDVPDGIKLHSKFGEGDGIPRCDSLFLKIPVSKREMENGKKAAKKAIKKKIKKFKKDHGGASYTACSRYWIR
ncbi:hypothetical protein PINS_up013749 [Pythium insidiosum]|nr:hypothetical protein PINS_up013749 [Pythium insidiosum]